MLFIAFTVWDADLQLMMRIYKNDFMQYCLHFIFINVHNRLEKMSEENLDSENLKRRINLIAGLKNNVEIVKKNLEV